MAACKHFSKTFLLCFYLKEKMPLIVINRSMAGHSKWANIKFKKMHRDIARAKVLGRLHKEILTVVREDGPDPALNFKLEQLIVRAKAANMTKEKIESAIKSAVKNTGDANHELLIEGHGPGGCGILVDTLTTNKIRTRTEIRTIFTKNNGHVGDEGSVSFMYERKGVINIENHLDPDDVGEDCNEEIVSQAEELAIEVGAENVFLGRNSDEKKHIQFICAPSDLIHISRVLTKDHNCVLLSANLEYLPKTLMGLSDNQLDKVHRLLEKIMEHDDVIKIYDNVKDYPSDSCKDVEIL